MWNCGIANEIRFVYTTNHARWISERHAMRARDYAIGWTVVVAACGDH